MKKKKKKREGKWKRWAGPDGDGMWDTRRSADLIGENFSSQTARKNGAPSAIVSFHPTRRL
jgi:hypothetical protein